MVTMPYKIIIQNRVMLQRKPLFLKNIIAMKQKNYLMINHIICYAMNQPTFGSYHHKIDACYKTPQKDFSMINLSWEV